MKPDEAGKPTIILPYPGPSLVDGEQDIFVYLRPETNGVIAESTILKVIKSANQHQDAMRLVFLANIPGEFIVDHHMVEQYYALRFHFAVNGKAAFTPAMAEHFTRHFSIPFATADITGSFEALTKLSMDAEELFRLWVPDKDVATVHGQVIKKIGSTYVVNYDVPALIHKIPKKQT